MGKETQANGGDVLTVLRVMGVSGDASLCCRGRRNLISDNRMLKDLLTLHKVLVGACTITSLDMPPKDYFIVICAVPSQTSLSLIASPLRFQTSLLHLREILDKLNFQRSHFSKRSSSPKYCKHELPPAIFCC